MNNKRLHREISGISKKRRRNIITFEMKLDIVKRYENKERSCDIARTLNLSQSTVRTILVQSDKIKERSKRLASLMGAKFIRPRSHTIENMEKRLAEWIKFETERNNPVSLGNIQEKARELYESIRIELNDTEAKPFVASHGWLDRFKKRIKLFQISTIEASKPVVTREINMDVVNKFPSIFKEVLDDGGYSPKQVFNINEFGLLWRRLPTYEYTPNNKILEKDRLTLILGANALGDYKLKPVVVYHSSNPVGLRGYSKDHLPVVWKYNPKGIITSSIFTDYFCNRLSNELKDYCLKENIPFKILLVLNSANHHPQCLEDFSENIRVLFLPPDTESYLQPIDNDIIQLFNAHYFHLMFVKILENIQGDDGRDNIEENSQNFTIKDSVDIIGQAWAKIHQSYLKPLWFRIWPEHAGEHKSFDLIDSLTKIKHQIIACTRIIGSESDIFKVSDYLMPPTEELTVEELEQLVETDTADDDNEHGIRTLSSEDLMEAFEHIKAAITIFDENDYNRERSFEVVRDLRNAIECYQQMYKEKMKHSTRINAISFVKVEPSDETEIEIKLNEVQGLQSNGSSESDYVCDDNDDDPIG